MYKPCSFDVIAMREVLPWEENMTNQPKISKEEA